MVVKISTPETGKWDIFGGSPQILGPSGPAPDSAGGAVMAPFGRSLWRACSGEILRKCDERFSRKSHFCFFLKECPMGKQVKKTDSLYIVFKVLHTRRDRTRPAGVCAAQRARRRATATSPGDYTAARNTISGFAGPEVVFYALP